MKNCQRHWKLDQRLAERFKTVNEKKTRSKGRDLPVEKTSTTSIVAGPRTGAGESDLESS